MSIEVAVTGTGPAAKAALTLSRSLSRKVEMTEIGSVCVIVTIGMAPEGETWLPGSICRMPVRPSIGERI
ncbi:hypothetical protein D3C71_1899410 [compost metagenome]